MLRQLGKLQMTSSQPSLLVPLFCLFCRLLETTKVIGTSKTCQQAPLLGVNNVFWYWITPKAWSEERVLPAPNSGLDVLRLAERDLRDHLTLIKLRHIVLRNGTEEKSRAVKLRGLDERVRTTNVDTEALRSGHAC